MTSRKISVVHCADCGFRREFGSKGLHVNAVAGGHARSPGCNPTVRYETRDVCESCGWGESARIEDLVDTSNDGSVSEDLLCDVCLNVRTEIGSKTED